ncbi:hypothetical protein ACVW0P_003862 [Mucilaginibacter sp. UYNi724]
MNLTLKKQVKFDSENYKFLLDLVNYRDLYVFNAKQALLPARGRAKKYLSIHLFTGNWRGISTLTQ